MPSLPTNRGPTQLGGPAPAPLPTRVQGGSFGTQPAAPAGGTITQGRLPQPRPAITSGPSQGRESFSAGELGPSVARALNEIQSKVADSTAQARANPMGNGRLFQGVTITGTPTAGTLASRPGRTGLPNGFMYFITTLEKPIWLSGTNWVDATGAVAYPASGFSLLTTKVDHGFGRPAAGVLITNVQNAVIQTAPRLVLEGDSTDNNTARIWFAYAPLSTEDPVADIYVYY
jgi:hypothetical protein